MGCDAIHRNRSQFPTLTAETFAQAPIVFDRQHPSLAIRHGPFLGVG
jgi:hypothetical protein